MGKSKERKIIKEFVDVKFKEIEQDKEQESELEEDTEPKEEGFSDFFSAERKAPVLESFPIPEALEETAETAPPTPATPAAAEEKKYFTVYNQPKYSPGGGEERAQPLVREMQESGILIRPEDTMTRQAAPRREQIREWHEIDRGERGRENPEAVTSAQRLEEERKLPFEQRKKYREIK